MMGNSFGAPFPFYPRGSMLSGNIWRLAYPEDWIVIPTSVGWNKYGEAVMGGPNINGQARALFPELPFWYGQQCQMMGDSQVLPWEEGRLILFPTKSLNRRKPHLSWKNFVSHETVAISLRQLVRLVPKLLGGNILLPPVGCTERDGLFLSAIAPLLMEAVEAQPRIILVRPPVLYETPCPSAKSAPRK